MVVGAMHSYARMLLYIMRKSWVSPNESLGDILIAAATRPGRNPYLIRTEVGQRLSSAGIVHLMNENPEDRYTGCSINPKAIGLVFECCG
jgi:hypothetical protein